LALMPAFVLLLNLTSLFGDKNIVSVTADV
jgi:hypothetical protein